MLINVTGCTEDEALEALGLLSNIEAFVVAPQTPTIPQSFFKLPTTDSQRQRVLLFFIREDRPLSRDEVKLGLNLDDGSADPRCLELLQGEWLVETGQTYTTRHGKTAALLALTAKAKQCVKLAPRKWFPMGVRIDPS